MIWLADYEKYKDYTVEQLKQEIKDIKKSHEFFFREFEKISEDNKLLKQTLNYITSKTD